MKSHTPAALVATALLWLPVGSASSVFAAARRQPEAQARDARALQGGSRSVQELIDQFLRALHQKDQDALRGLRGTEREYRSIILPGSVKPGEPPRRLAGEWIEFLWGSLDTRSHYNERDMVRALGGKELTLRQMAFDGGERQYAGYKAYRELRLELSDGDGQALSIDTGSIAEVGGRYKFIAFMRD
jgi:hypothetical protein